MQEGRALSDRTLGAEWRYAPPVRGTDLEIQTPDGAMWAYEAPAAADTPRGAVLFFMDGLGIRPALCGMADRLADAGYHVLVPDLYHRLGRYVHFDPTWMTIPEKVGEIRKTIGALTTDMVMSDAKAALDLLAARPGVDPARLGAVGYCMGGRFAFLAATRFPDRLRAAAAIHPGGVVTADPTSPHLAAEHAKARLYFGIARDDMFFTREQADALAAHLTQLGKRFEIEHYAGRHGWAIPDAPVFDPAEAERHWAAVLALFRAELGARARD